MSDTESTAQADSAAVAGQGSMQNASARPASTGSILILEGRTHSSTATGRGWAHVVGWVAFRQMLTWLSGVIGIRRTTRLALRDESVSVTERLTIFGAVVHEEEQRIPAGKVVSVSSVRALPSLPLLAGAVILIVALVWGVLRIVEGVVGGSAKMVLLGLAVLAIGAVADVLLFLVTQNLFHPGRFGVSVHLSDRRSIGVWGVPEDNARRATEFYNPR
jgi:hypothetical protein